MKRTWRGRVGVWGGGVDGASKHPHPTYLRRGEIVERGPKVALGTTQLVD